MMEQFKLIVSLNQNEWKRERERERDTETETERHGKNNASRKQPSKANSKNRHYFGPKPVNIRGTECQTDT